jgi:hypothetical protein
MARAPNREDATRAAEKRRVTDEHTQAVVTTLAVLNARTIRQGFPRSTPSAAGS